MKYAFFIAALGLFAIPAYIYGVNSNAVTQEQTTETILVSAETKQKVEEVQSSNTHDSQEPAAREANSSAEEPSSSDNGQSDEILFNHEEYTLEIAFELVEKIKLQISTEKSYQEELFKVKNATEEKLARALEILDQLREQALAGSDSEKLLVQSLERRKQDISLSVQELNTEYAKLKSEFEQYEKNIEKASQELSLIKDKNSKLEVYLSTVQVKLSSYKKRYDSVCRKYEKLQADLKRLKKENERIRGELSK